MQNLSHQCLPLHTNTCAIAAENSYLITTVAHISSSISMPFSIIKSIFSSIFFLAIHSAIKTPHLSKPEYTHPKGISNLSALKTPNLSKPEFTHRKGRSNLFDSQVSAWAWISHSTFSSDLCPFIATAGNRSSDSSNFLFRFQQSYGWWWTAYLHNNTIPLKNCTNLLLSLQLSRLQGVRVLEGFRVNCKWMNHSDGVQSGIVWLRNSQQVVVE